MQVGRIPEGVLSAQSMKDQMESFFLTCMCMSFHRKVAWQVELFFLHVSGRRQFNLKGGCATLFHFFWHGETRVLFLHVLFETKYKPNETKPTVDVQIQSCEALQSCGTQIFVFSRNTGEREALLMKHCSDVKHSSLDVNLCMSVEFVLSFACLWTHLDRVGLQFLMFLQCFG